MNGKLTITPETTLGPFYPETFVPLDSNDLTTTRLGQPRAAGEKIWLHGKVRDLNGMGRPRILIEIWQANAKGAYRHGSEPDKEKLDPNFDGWGRALSDDSGYYEFLTVVPGAHGRRAPHINFTLFGTGIDRLQTAAFLPGSKASGKDPVLAACGGRADLLIATEDGEREDGIRQIRFDIQMRGKDETPFFLD